jgi:hypothetical protein
MLEELFPGNLEGLDIDLLKKATLGDRIVPRTCCGPLPRRA